MGIFAFQPSFNNTQVLDKIIETYDFSSKIMLAEHFEMATSSLSGRYRQQILGHTDIKMTMRYSHFAPEHLNDALMFNPLVKLKL
ncbi:helix-turn-helix domain-containing protein [Proteus terrae]|uniref:helix-turn-helix domain-containing protein n=1 Tax=Proteus terrae TaxID=1574161 RepID=UPI0035D4C027